MIHVNIVAVTYTFALVLGFISITYGTTLLLIQKTPPPFPLSELYHTTKKQSTFLAYASANTFSFLNLIIILNCENNVKNNAKVLTFISSVI